MVLTFSGKKDGGVCAAALAMSSLRVPALKCSSNMHISVSFSNHISLRGVSICLIRLMILMRF